MITIKEIAAMAGVAPTTVSNVLHGRTSRMSKETMEKVRAILEETHYTQEATAGMAAGYGSRIIGVIMTYGKRDIRNAVQDPFYGEMAGALEKEIRKNGYAMMLYASASVEESLQAASSFSMEGLIVLNFSAPDCKRFLQKARVPVVFTDSCCPKELEGCCSVGLQDLEGAYRMTAYLLKKGHRRIAFLAEGSRLAGVDALRFDGYRKAMEEAATPWQEHIVLPVVDEVRHRRLEQLCRSGFKQYTALFFASDFYAVDAVNLFFSLGIRVPEEISVAGFDDNLLARMCRPGLTTVHQEPAQKARQAVRLLFSCIAEKESRSQEILLPVSITERGSVRSLKE